MSLNVKNPQAHDLARELAELTGESLTAAVMTSLDERLQRERQRRMTRKKAERILDFAERFSAGMPGDAHSSEHADIYGEDGLPR